MKQLLLFFLFISLSISVFSQVEGPPPAPCGYTPAYACDDNGDGFEVFDLVEAFPFDTFCRIDKGEPEEYYPIAYYLTLDDMYNQTNPIINPEAYTNISNPQIIYYRANKIVPDSIEFLAKENPIEVNSLTTITPLETCNYDQDGSTIFNLDELLSFETFCREDKGLSNDYYPIVYYLTIEDRANQTNPIQNPANFVNKSNNQSIYYRANKIEPNQSITYLTANALIEATRLIPQESVISFYDDDSDGLSNFDLTSIDVFCNSNVKSDYSVSYHLSYEDANSGNNSIANPTAFQNTSNPQYIYVRALHNDTGNVDTTNFKLKALFAVAHSPGVPDIYKCDFDEDRQDGVYAVDLMYYNSIILGNQDPDNFTVSYYASQDDAENKANQLQSIYTVSDQQTIYARVDENTKGSYAITSFVFSIFSPPVVSPLDPYEICDDDGDGKAVFDLSLIRDIINSGGVIYDITMFETYEDANNGNRPHIGLNNDYNNYINVTNPQTIYVKVEDMEGFGCSTILPLELVVKDCSTLGVIEIKPFYDANTNTAFDNDEINFLNGTLTYEKNNDGILRNLYSSNGVFNIISDDDSNTYEIGYEVLSEYDSCYDVSTAPFENVQVNNGSTVNYNVPITKIQDCGDIAVYLVSYAPPRPGFNYFNRLIIRNQGLEAVTSGSIEFTHDPSVTLNNVSGVDAGNSITNTGTGFILNFVDLQPNQQEYVVINMNVPIPTSLGTLLTNSAVYSVSDLSDENNTSILSEVVIGSYDPNDIAESHGPEILHSSFDSEDYLYYTVRFQNVGTADAINVSIDNTLNTKLDKSTIQMLASSHTNVFTRTDNQLNWQFDNIHLPSEDMDEPNSHGYVYYKIKPLAGYSVGDIIPNTAEIYFDFNPAVVTNTFETEFTTTLSKVEFSDVEFSMFPNPAKNNVELKFNNAISNTINTSIYDIQGKLILNSKKKLKNSVIQLNVSALKSGMYFLKVDDGNHVMAKKMIVE